MVESRWSPWTVGEMSCRTACRGIRSIEYGSPPAGRQENRPVHHLKPCAMPPDFTRTSLAGFVTLIGTVTLWSAAAEALHAEMV